MFICFAIICIGLAISIYIVKTYSVKTVALPLEGLYFVCLFAASALVLSLISFVIAGKWLALDFNPLSSSTLLTIMAITLSAVCEELILSVIRRQRKDRNFFAGYPVYLVMFEIFVVITLIVVILNPQLTMETDDSRQYMIAFVLLFLSACLTVFLMTNYMERKVAGQALEDAKLQSGLEKIQFADIEDRRVELERIRGEYDTILTNVLHLIDRDDVESARNLLDDLSVRIEATREYPFCGIPVINAVLTEKKKQCDLKNIGFSVELLLPEQLPVKEIDLCMVLGNLLDNAIRACEKFPDTGQDAKADRPKIVLAGKIVHGYLVIKCVNSVCDEEVKPYRQGGYGIKILNDIAARYEGDFFTECEDGIFTAQLSLPVAASESREALQC